MKRPEVVPRNWIHVAPKSALRGRDAVVCRIRGDLVEVVYLDRDLAINEYVCWRDDYWEFAREGPAGGYADNIDRLSEFVRVLRGGRRR